MMSFGPRVTRGRNLNTKLRMLKRFFISYILVLLFTPASFSQEDDILMKKNYGDIAFYAGDYQKALKLYEEALAQSQDSGIFDKEFYFRMGYSYQKRHNNKLAEQYYLKSLRPGPDNHQQYIIISDFFNKNDNTDLAIEVIETGLKHFPAEREKLIEKLISSYSEDGQLNRAMEIIDNAIEQNPDDYKLYYLRGNLLEELGRKDGALENYIMSTKLNREFTNSFIKSGSLIYHNTYRKHETAREKYDKIAKPTQKQYLEQKEKLSHISNEYLSALSYLEHAHELSPGNKSVIELIASIHRMLNNPKEAAHYQGLLK